MLIYIGILDQGTLLDSVVALGHVSQEKGGVVANSGTPSESRPNYNSHATWAEEHWRQKITLRLDECATLMV